ncbi:hypothetical protein K9838_05515 [Xanthomonas phaseoli pv. manihotis]|nr:hypothetical protein [Xanthomonas phaseoli]UEQ16114.1 hypothetical protein K9838_05515 [Xanthomonas phaseoli pv. manihotis]
MRLDRRLIKLQQITENQRYFLSCWFNMVHEYSLDSFRVRAMNPITLSREILHIMDFPEGKVDDKRVILDETFKLFDSDDILKSPEFKSIRDRICQLLGADRAKLAAGKSPAEQMLMFSIKEVVPVLAERYVDTAFNELTRLLSIADIDSTPEDRQRINFILGGVLSALLDSDYSLESLFSIYKEVLVPRKDRGKYIFDNKLGLTKRLLTESKRNFDVCFSGDFIAIPGDFPTVLANIEITEDAPFELNSKHSKNSYLDKIKNRRFFTIREVIGVDRRAAGLRAYDQLANVINLLRFEYEQSRILIPSQFAIRDSLDLKAGARIYTVPRVVPNPNMPIDGNSAAAFVTSVNELKAGPYFSSEGRDRIESAFRLYRQGKDLDTIEAKLVHWWTALEYLVRGGTLGSGIAKSVENSLAPVIVLNYVPKLLSSVKNLFVALDLELTGSNGELIEIKGLSQTEIWGLLQDKNHANQIDRALAVDPYLKEQVTIFVSELSQPDLLFKKLERHEERVRWQLQRIWRARCDIVHSAARGANHLLLCSNLEFYLKTALNGLLASLRTIPTLSGPHEYFQREMYRSEAIKGLMQKKDVDKIRAMLATSPRPE